MKAYLFFFFVFITFAASAQTDDLATTVWNIDHNQTSDGNTTTQVNHSKDIFGNKVKTVTGDAGQTVRTVTQSKDIFGHPTATVTGPIGQTVLTTQTSTDVMGRQVRQINGPIGENLGTSTTSTDAAGIKTTVIHNNQTNTTTTIRSQKDIFGNDQVLDTTQQ